MGQFDVYRRPNASHFLLDVQSRMLDDLATKACVPLQTKTPVLKTSPQLNPEFSIDGEVYVMMTHYILSVPARDLRNPITNLLHEHYRITSALNMLFQGF